VFGVKQELVADFQKVDDADEARRYGMAAPFWRVDWDFVLAPAAGAASREELIGRITAG